MERDDVPEAVNGRQVVAPLTMLSMTLLLIFQIPLAHRRYLFFTPAIVFS
jgi:hypothetical protein